MIIIVSPWVNQHAHICPCVRVRRAFEVLDAIAVQEFAYVICTNARLIDPDGQVVIVEPFFGKFVPAAVRFDHGGDIRIVGSSIQQSERLTRLMQERGLRNDTHLPVRKFTRDGQHQATVQ